MAPFWCRIWALFVSNGMAAPVDMRVVKRAGVGALLMLIGCVWALGAACNGALGAWQWRRNATATTRAVPALFGLWQVESLLIGGVAEPFGGPLRWIDIAIDRGNMLRIRSSWGTVLHCPYSEDLASGTITLSMGPHGRMDWQIERSVVVRQGPNPSPRRPEDFTTLVDIEHDAMTFRGEWQNQSFEARTVKKEFLYDQPFRLIFENPR
jgi:hypothetical protein